MRNGYFIVRQNLYLAGRQNLLRITHLFSGMEVYSIRVAAKSGHNTEREREEATMFNFCQCQHFWVFGSIWFGRKFNVHSSGQLKPGRSGYRFSPARTLRKTSRTFIEANVN
jgi:hypothetical protein